MAKSRMTIVVHTSGRYVAIEFPILWLTFGLDIVKSLVFFVEVGKMVLISSVLAGVLGM